MAETELQMRHHLQASGLEDGTGSWRIGLSPLGGRGMFAERDFEEGEDIFLDKALILGPRHQSRPLCSICYKNDGQFFACSRGCGVSVCSESCESSLQHQLECELILKWSSAEKRLEISEDVMDALTPIRALFLSGKQKELVRCLISHSGSYHGTEIDRLKKAGFRLEEEEDEFLKQVCGALDANAFETVIQVEKHNVSIRGLFPLASMMNHCCVPNSTHFFDSEGRMIVRTSTKVARGSELTTSYTTLLWGTPARRRHLMVTKNFSCECSRCKDPMEFGSALSGLHCPHIGCLGQLFPENPTNFTSPWKCCICPTRISARSAGLAQSAMASLLNSPMETPMDLVNMLRGRLCKALPTTNHIAIELKTRLMWTLGRKKGFLWKELNDELLDYKESICRELILLLDQLKAGSCKMKGLFLVELFHCLKEKSSRIRDKEEAFKVSNKECETYLNKAKVILKDDISSRSLLEEMLETN